MMKRYQRGTTVVEFAIVGALLLMLIFAVIETGRALFTLNMLTEATRRGARFAAVCPVGDPKPAQVAVFDAGGGKSAVVHGLKTSNVAVEYLDTSGNVIANPTANFNNIHYVRVRIVGYTESLIIPFIMPTLSLSGFSTTLPRESLGVPRVGVVQPC
jgi:Flp pilus assembly protein TadG